ncbi:MAG: hypothetical protein C0596_01955 [Marinilabiliales bacterium]|nr:MAG: hypothetical protein C0596_01955 [Marinilabiliales bacterium]
MQSSCEAPYEITENYKIDAGVLTLRKFYDNDMNYMDSIEIPTLHVDTFLNALLAVWNASELPARDSVVDMLEIYAAFNYDVRGFSFKCDKSLEWANNIIEGMDISGNEEVDSLMELYQLEYYYHLNSIDHYYIYLISHVNYNMPQLSKEFEQIPDIISVFATEGQYANQMDRNITAEIHQEYIDLEYSYGWGDCMSGCLNWRFWNFRTYYDCSVEYIGSHGNLLPSAGVNYNESLSAINVYPNPFYDKIYISGLKGIVEFSLYNTNGDILQKGMVENNIINPKNSLIPGIYFLELINNHTAVTKRIFKLH